MAKDPLTEIVERQGEAYRDIFQNAYASTRDYRVEVAYLAAFLFAIAVAYVLTAGNLISAVTVVVVLTLGLLRNVRTRRWVLMARDSARIRRRWDTATKYCGFDHPLPMTKVRRVAGGYRARVRVGYGISFVDVDRRREALAASLQIRELRVSRDPHNAGTGTVMLMSADPLTERAGTAWPGIRGLPHVPRPHRNHPREDGESGNGGNGGGPPQPILPGGPRTSLWRAVPVGVDENGDVIAVTLPERNILIGGTPGSGKSSAVAMLLASAALDPNVRIFLIDGKMVEFAEWEDCAEGVAHSLGNAVFVLTRIQMLMERRYQTLRDRGLRKVEEGSNLDLIALFVDELALFTSSGDTKASKEFTILLTDLVARGRAAGIIVCAATQKPEGTVVSTNLRDLFAYRWALRCGTPEASDTILGRGNAAQGYNATTVAPGEPGTGYLLAEDGLPKRLRTFYLNDDEIRALAARAKEVRRR